MKTGLWIIAFVILGFGISSCSKKGCEDPNADNFDEDAQRDDGSCLFRFTSGINVNAFPALDGNGNAWDVAGAPDIYIRFAKAASSTWDHSTSTMTDASAPTSVIVLNEPIKFTNEDWQFQVMDYDWPSADDVMASGTFNPLVAGEGGNILVTTVNGTSLTFQYSLKKE